MTVIFDMETDGLYEDATVIHCAVAYDIINDHFITFTPDTVHKISAYLDTVKSLSMHNGIGFDLRVLKKLLNYTYKGEYIDTLMLSRILYPDITKPSFINDKGKEEKVKGGPHSIEAWGVRMGISKPVHEDWSKFTPAMLHRCKEDTKIQAAVFRKMQEEIQNYEKKDRRLKGAFNKVLRMEQYFWQGMETQASNGWQLDIDLCFKYFKQLEKEIEEIDSKIDSILPYRLITPYKDKTCTAFKKNGEITTNAKNWFEKFPRINEQPSGDFSRVTFEKVSLNSPEQLKDYLLSLGWVPTQYNYKKDSYGKPMKDDNKQLIWTTPKTPNSVEEWERLADDLDTPQIRYLTRRAQLKHRYGMMKGFLDNVRPDRRLEAQMNSCGTNTARATHRIIVNVPRATEENFFGKECRSVFIVPEGKVLVGADASALEARCEAHYLYKIDKAAAEMLIHGDIHSYNMMIWDVTRSLAKNGKYALTYGCSPKKLATTLNKPEAMSNELYEAFWDANPALKELRRRIEEQFDIHKYLVAIDGRPLCIRYKHALVNTLFQSAGSIAMKTAWCFWDQYRKRHKIPAIDVGNFHDELQVETLPEYAEEVGQTIVDCIGKAGQFLKFNVPLTGEYKIGCNWAETH